MRSFRSCSRCGAEFRDAEKVKRDDHVWNFRHPRTDATVSNVSIRWRHAGDCPPRLRRSIEAARARRIRRELIA